MAKLKKIGVLSFTKFLAALMAFAGLITGILYSFGGAIYDVVKGFPVGSEGDLPTWLCGPPVCLIAFGAIIGMPIIFAVPGFIAGAIGAFLYNLGARWVGRIEVDLEQEA